MKKMVGKSRKGKQKAAKTSAQSSPSKDPPAGIVF